MDSFEADFTPLDRPDILMFLFHPRREWVATGVFGPWEDLLIPVGKDVSIGARFHKVTLYSPTVLFFHGNGEIVSDYDDIGPIYNRLGINFLAVDYRGYGRSTGSPTVTAMMKDCHRVFQFVESWLREKGFSGPLVLMGRSLGSASAIELAFHYQARVEGLILESGFASATPLLRLLGIDPTGLRYSEEKGFNHLKKIKTFTKPTLIIHAEHDHLIPFSEGKALYDACGSKEKTLLPIQGADHNTIFAHGLKEYMAAIQRLTAFVSHRI